MARLELVHRRDDEARWVRGQVREVGLSLRLVLIGSLVS